MILLLNVVMTFCAVATLIITAVWWMESTKRWPAWLAMPSVDPATYQAVIFVALMASIVACWLRLRRVETRREPPGPPRLLVTDRTSALVAARFGDRVIELEPAADEYFHRQLEDWQREKILQMIAKHPAKGMWTKKEFVVEVDEKARIRFTLDDFIGIGNQLLAQAEEIEKTLRAESSPPRTGLTAGLPTPAAVDATALKFRVDGWEDDAYAYLKKETHGHAEGFKSPITNPPQGHVLEECAYRPNVNAGIGRR